MHTTLHKFLLQRCLKFTTSFLFLSMLFFLLATASWQPVAAQEPPTREVRIVGGQEATPGEYPWQVMFFSGNSFCGGSLIAPNWVLTAAHCVSNAASRVVLGAHSLNNNNESTRQTITVKRQIAHPNYNSQTFDNDIALLELASPAVLNARVALVPRAAHSADDPLFAAGKLATITGWGTTSQNGSLASALQEVSVPIVDRTVCNQSYNGEITNNMMCAGRAEGGADSCQGDSGGPLIVPNGNGGWKLAGIVSWGNGCAQANYYGVYTVVANYTAWVDSYIGNSTPPTPTPTAPPTETPDPTTPEPTPEATETPEPTETSEPPADAVVLNGDFEQGGNGDWTESSSQDYALITNESDLIPAGGEYMAWLGGADEELSKLSQEIKLPDSTPLYLHFDYQVFSEDYCGYDFARVSINAIRIKSFALCEDRQTDDWIHAVVDVSRYASQTVRLRFSTLTDYTFPSSFFVDNVEISQASRVFDDRVLTIIDQIDNLEGGDEDEYEEETDIRPSLYLPLVRR